MCYLAGTLFVGVKMNYFAYLKDGNYPTDELFSAEKVYPEYIFDAEALSKKNDVYRMIRDIFIKIGLDKENIGTKYWNPLGRYISEGDTVLVKPNLVNHINVAEDDMQRGMDCLITHPSVVRCIFDYVYIALKGKGKIIIADAPVQNCDFDKLLDNSGYRKLFEYLKSLQTPELTVEIGDLRGTILVKENGCQKQIDRENVQWRGRIIDLKSNSNFAKLSTSRKLRITNYHGGETVKHHTNGKNEYCISEAALQADVIINLVKPKTHRIAGYTAALKNMIGINTRKEYLPHHRKGSVKRGGDEYQHSHLLLKFLNSTGNDIKNWALMRGMTKLTDRMNQFCRMTGRKLDSLEKSRKQFGMWFGNDTIWRTILDVNYIVKYTDKDGCLRDEEQRKIIHLGDMIVCGEKEGPMRPSYKHVGGMLFSENSVEFDACVVKMMGFDYKKLPTLNRALQDKRLFVGDLGEIYLDSNEEEFCGCLSDMKVKFDFCPTKGWEDIL